MEQIEKKARKIARDYAQHKFLYKNFAFSVKRIIEEIIKKEGLDKYVQIITAREKNPESLIKKLINKKFEDSLNGSTYLEERGINRYSDVKDLAGVRVILYFKGDVLRKLRLALQEEFDYSSKDEEKHSDIEGQESIHSLIKFNEKRLMLSEYVKFKELKCEIQLVTILQHAWSELEHDIVYKPQENWKKAEIEKFDNMFKEAKDYIKKASDVFESIMYIHLNEDKFLLIDKFDNLNNNKLYEYLERLRAFMEKNYIKNDVVLKDIADRIKRIILVAKSNKVTKEKNIFGDFEGRKFEEILLKILNILNDSRVKYSSQENFKYIFNSAVDWSNLLKEDSERKEVYEFFRRISKYDYQILKQFGFLNQRLIVDIISKWTGEKKIENVGIIKIVVREFLQPSYEWLNMAERNKLQFSIGSLAADKGGHLAKIRKESIDLVAELYGLISDEKEGFELIKLLNEATRTAHPETDDALEQIIIENAKYLFAKYQEIVFDKKDKVVCSLSVAREAERQLSWFKKGWLKEEGEKVEVFMERLNADRRYRVYGRLVDLDRFVRPKDRDREIGRIFLAVKVVANEDWLNILNDIAKASVIDEDWSYNDFHGFLTHLTEKDPKQGEYFLEAALKMDLALSGFSDAFLVGFRNLGQYDLWDKYVLEIEKLNDGNLLSKILQAFYANIKNSRERKFRNKDFRWIRSVAGRKGRYAFLLDGGYNKYYFDDVLFRAMLIFWKYEKKGIEILLIDEIRRVDGDFLERKLDEIVLFVSWNDLAIVGWEKENVEYLVSCLMKSKRMDYQNQRLIKEIGKIDFGYVLRVIKGRLGYLEKRKITGYDALPMHLEEDFILLIEENKSVFIKEMILFIEKRDRDSGIFYELTAFLYSLGAIYREILIGLMKKNNEMTFEKVVEMLRTMDKSDLGLDTEVAERIIGSKKVTQGARRILLGRISSAMYSTGVVSGEHGFSVAFDEKVRELNEIKKSLEKDRKSGALVSFIKERMSVFNKRAKDEKNNEDRQVKMMDIDYES